MNSDHAAALLEEPRGAPILPPPRPLPKWRLTRVLSGHTGWIRALAPDPTHNAWLASASADRTIKLWDLASSTLLLTLTGHTSTVRSLSPSPRHPFIFSGGEDRQVKCWDLECNQVVRHYHGHLHAVNQVKVHPQLDIIGTASRDCTVKLWDMRSRQCIHTLAGHSDAVNGLVLNDCGPQVISASSDGTIRLWDIVSGRTMAVLTHHKKGVRGLALTPNEHTFGSAGDKIKRWSLPNGRFLQNMSVETNVSTTDSVTIWNAMDINGDAVAATGSDSGELAFWDWKSGSLINKINAPVQPGSLDCEAGILAVSFDVTGLRLFTGDVDKTIKVYKEVEEDIY